MPTALTDLRELKALMDIPLDDTSEDKKLLFLVTLASGWIEELLGRQLMYKNRTEFYNGTGTRALPLRARPVHPQVGLDDEIKVYVDLYANYGSVPGAFGESTRLYYGYGFCLDLDQDDGTSRSGILVRMNTAGTSGQNPGGQGQGGGVWQKPIYRDSGLLSPYRGQAFGNIKVVYSAGYTIDTLPAGLRLAVNTLVMKLAYFMPLGMELSSESYEERSIGIAAAQKSYLLGTVWTMLTQYRNWKF